MIDILIAFFTGLCQVFLVVYQTRQIAHKAPLWSITLVGTLISTVWVMNVHAVSSGWVCSVAYVAGTGTGTLVAMLVRIRPSLKIGGTEHAHQIAKEKLAEKRKEPEAQKQQIAQVKGGVSRVASEFRSAKSVEELQQALVSYRKFVASFQSMKLNLTPTRELNGVLGGLKTSVEKSVIEVATVS